MGLLWRMGRPGVGRLILFLGRRDREFLFCFCRCLYLLLRFFNRHVKYLVTLLHHLVCGSCFDCAVCIHAYINKTPISQHLTFKRRFTLHSSQDKTTPTQASSKDPSRQSTTTSPPLNSPHSPTKPQQPSVHPPRPPF